MTYSLPTPPLHVPNGSDAGLASFFRPVTGLNTGIFLLMP